MNEMVSIGHRDYGQVYDPGSSDTMRILLLEDLVLAVKVPGGTKAIAELVQ